MTQYSRTSHEENQAQRSPLNGARMIHDGSSSPSLTLPHSMGEGEGGGPFLVKRISLGIRAYGSYSRRGERMAYGRQPALEQYEIVFVRAIRH
jgi:hypothetical protein